MNANILYCSFFVRLALISAGGLITLLGGCRRQIDPPVSDNSVTSKSLATSVEDETCANCHAEIFESYQYVAMARSFYKPSPRVMTEDFAQNHFYHEASDRHYEMLRRGDQYFQRRYQLDDAQREINVIGNRLTT